MSEDSLGDFEDPEQSQSPQDTYAKWGPGFNGSPDHLKNTANNHLWTQSDKCRRPPQIFINYYINTFVPETPVLQSWIIWITPNKLKPWTKMTLTKCWLIKLPSEQDDSPQSQNSWTRSGSSSGVPGHTFSWTSPPETGPEIQTQPGLWTWKHTDQCSGLKRASLLIFAIQKSWATATCSAVATANKTQKESIVWKNNCCMLPW